MIEREQSREPFDREIREATSFSEFVKYVSSDLLEGYIFRGQAAAEWELLPRVYRREFRQIADATHLVAIETEILDAFKRLARPYLREGQLRDWELLALAQHHGLPTRLLDWTTNGMAALYFAVGEDAESDSAVWCYQYAGPVADMASNPFEILRVMKFDPPHIAQRIVVQSGCFTAHPPEFVDTSEWWPGKMVKIVVPNAIRRDSLEALARIGIHRASLFPDLDGIARHIREKYSSRNSASKGPSRKI